MTKTKVKAAKFLYKSSPDYRIISIDSYKAIKKALIDTTFWAPEIYPTLPYSETTLSVLLYKDWRTVLEEIGEE